MSAASAARSLAPSSSGAAPAGRRIRAQAAMELRLLLRNGENLLVAVGIPVGMLVLFALVPVVDFDEPAVDFLLPGAVTVAIMGSAMVSLGISTGFERFYLVLKRLGATPLRRGELIAAKVLAIIVVQTVQVLLLVGVAMGLGWPEMAAPPRPQPFLAAAALLLGTAAFAGLGLAMAGRLRATATLALTNALFLVLLLASGLVFPLDRLPGPVAAATTVLPSAALGEVLRYALLPREDLPAIALAVLAAWAVGACALAARIFRWE